MTNATLRAVFVKNGALVFRGLPIRSHGFSGRCHASSNNIIVRILRVTVPACCSEAFFFATVVQPVTAHAVNFSTEHLYGTVS
jgi:hypothetical protein